MQAVPCSEGNWFEFPFTSFLGDSKGPDATLALDLRFQFQLRFSAVVADLNERARAGRVSPKHIRVRTKEGPQGYLAVFRKARCLCEGLDAGGIVRDDARCKITEVPEDHRNLRHTNARH
jgi:hypothetical protein